MKCIYKGRVLKTFFKIFLFPWIVLVLFAGSILAQITPGGINPMSGISNGVFAPLRIAVDKQGKTYVTDAHKKVVSVYDVSGNFLGTINDVALPVSVAVNNEGELFIGDGATGHIFSYDEVLGATEFYSGTVYPTSMEFNPDNNLYISDSKLQQVVVIDISGNLIQTIGSGILDFPTGIALDNNNKRILVGEHGGKGTGFSPVVKVWMFDLQGNLINYFGRHGNSDGRFYRVQGIAIGKCGDIYVVDPYLARISVFNENGVFKTKFGIWGEQAGQMNIPMDVSFDAQERLIITSMNNGNLELFSISDTLPCSNIKTESAMICAGDSTEIEIAFEGTAPWTFTYTNDGLNPQIITTGNNPYFLTVSSAGLYEVTALADANYTGSCFTGSADITVTAVAPTAVMTGDAVLCAGEITDISIVFTGSPPWSFTYTISGLNPTNVTTTNNPYIFTVSEAGYYEIAALLGAGCEGTSITGGAEIVINPLPTATITNGNEQVFITNGEKADLSVALTGTPPWDITYTVDDLFPVLIPNITISPYILEVSGAGTYEIKEVSDAHCNNNVTLGFPEVVIIPAGCFTVNLVSDNYSVTENKTTFVWELYANNCTKGLTYIAFEIPDYTIALDPVNNLHYAFPGNQYSYLVKNPFGNVKKGNCSIKFKSLAGGISNGGPEKFVYSLPGEVNMQDVIVEIRSRNTVCHILAEKSGEIMVDFPEFESLQIKAYPNPVINNLFFEFRSPVDTYGRLEIFDITGSKLKTVFDGNLRAGQNYKVEYDPGAISSGMIFYILVTKENNVSGKVIYYGE